MPVKELYANAAIGFLSGPVTSTSATSIALQNSSKFPSSGNFTCRVDDEILLVTANSANTFTVQRGQEGSAAATHPDGAAIYLVFTEGSLHRLVRESHGGTNVAARRELNFVDGGGVTWSLSDDSTNDKVDISASASSTPSFEVPIVAPPSAGTFTWANQGTASVVTPSYGGLFLQDVGNGSLNLRALLITAPSAPYTLTAKIRPLMRALDYLTVGLVWCDGTKFTTNGVHNNSFEVQNYNSATAFNGTVINGVSMQQGFGNLWFRLKDDNTNRYFQVGNDGENFITLAQVTRTTFLTPTSVGFFINPQNQAGNTWPAGALLQSWNITQP